MLDELKISLQEPVKLMGDNKSAISMVHEPIQHERTKHVQTISALHKSNHFSKVQTFHEDY